MRPRPGGPPSRGPGGPPRFAPRPPGPPPTADQINLLAKRERVPARIAKGELEGKMKCRIWKKLHAEEAKRFSQVYDLMEQTPGLPLADAFGALQAGLTPQEFLTRKARTQKKAEVKEARVAVAGDEVDAFLQGLIADKIELGVVIAARATLDVLTGLEPVAFLLERTGRLQKLQVVMLARRSTWERVGPALERDAKLSQKPAGIARQPEKRPVADPRIFLPMVGKKVNLTLRNGLKLTETLLTAGPFDLLLGEAGEELFVPLHAIVRWSEPVMESP